MRTTALPDVGGFIKTGAARERKRKRLTSWVCSRWRLLFLSRIILPKAGCEPPYAFRTCCETFGEFGAAALEPFVGAEVPAFRTGSGPIMRRRRSQCRLERVAQPQSHVPQRRNASTGVAWVDQIEDDSACA